MKENRMTISLVKLADEHTIAFKEEMQEAFQLGFQSHFQADDERHDDANQWQVAG